MIKVCFMSALRHPGPALSVSCLCDTKRENKSWEEEKRSRCVEHSQHHAWAPLQEHQPGVKHVYQVTHDTSTGLT